MKKSIIISLLFVMLTADPVLTQAWHTEGYYDVRECAICGKTIYVYQEPSYGPYMPSMIAGEPGCPGELACTLRTLILTSYVCLGCEHKYSKEFSGHVESFFVDRRLENIKLIEKHQEERRLKDVEDRKNKIIELERELEGLKK